VGAVAPAPAFVDIRIAALRCGGAGVGIERSGAGSQRRRLLDAMVCVADEHGYAGASVALVIERAGVSRRTFYELFDSAEDCFGAVIDEALVRISALISDGFEREQTWHDGIRSVLAGLLAYLDSDLSLARVWLIEAIVAGSWALERRERHIAALRARVVEHWVPPSQGRLCADPPDSPSVIGVMSAVVGVIHTHLITRQQEPLIVLLAPLVGLVASPYFSATDTEAQVARAEELAQALLASPYPPPQAPLGEESSEAEVPDALLDPRAHRARACLLYVAKHPGTSNREVAAGIQVASHTQASTLLRRLFELGLLVKGRATRRGNAWTLTEEGADVARTLEGSRADG
jgi:AcrR family transcriptional regulator